LSKPEIDVDLSSTGAVYSLVNYLRESITDILFEIFMRSFDKASKNNSASSVLFGANMKEMLPRGLFGFALMLRTYMG
jgi:hypothetical protein